MRILDVRRKVDPNNNYFDIVERVFILSDLGLRIVNLS